MTTNRTAATNSMATVLAAFVMSAAAHGACGGHDMGGMGDMEGGHDMIPPVIEVAATEGNFEPSAAADTDPSPTVVEVALEARVANIEIAPGHVLPMWTYNGQLPGPRIEARVGDTLRVHFKNSLPEATTIHWHGVRVPAVMDGVAATQAPIAPGTEFTYDFALPDAGTFWYHPHVRSDEQVERGLYGAIVVRGDNEPTTTTDRTVVLDDLLLDTNWQLQGFDSTQAMLGRQGNVILANGWAHPIARVERGGLHRFRFVNAANARYFRLALPGYRLIQIGSDGGLLAAPREVDDLLLVPGERTDVLVIAAGEAGQAIEWKSLRYDRGHGTGDLPDATIFRLKTTDGPPVAPPSVPPSLRSIDDLPPTTVQRELRLEESMDMASSSGSQMGTVFSINGQVYPHATPITSTLGSVEAWSIVNTTEMDHPFHLHGFRFQVVSIDGQAPGFSAWRDSINVPARKTVIFAVRLEEHPGTWMFHCHILEHAERGMMGELRVAGP